MTLQGGANGADTDGSQIDTSMTAQSAAAMLAQNNMAQIDLMLYRFIEHRQLFEFIEVYKVYLNNKSKEQESADNNLDGKTFLHLAIEHSAT